MNRHTARTKNTDQRCVVVFKQLPDRPTHALIIPTDSLPPRYEAALMSLLDSPEGKAEINLYNLLGRRLMPETGKSVLQTFHEAGLVHTQPVDNIIMYPTPNMPIPLRQVIESMGQSVPENKAAQPPTPQEAVQSPLPPVEKFNPYGETKAQVTTEENAARARNLIIEAEMLEFEANRKREAAYSFDPSTRPAPVPTPVTNTETFSTETLVEATTAPKKRKTKAAQ